MGFGAVMLGMGGNWSCNVRGGGNWSCNVRGGGNWSCNVRGVGIGAVMLEGWELEL